MDQPDPVAISTALRAAFAASGLTAYELSKRSGVPKQTLSRWVAGTGGLTLANADKIAAGLGLICTFARTRKID